MAKKRKLECENREHVDLKWKLETGGRRENSPYEKDWLPQQIPNFSQFSLSRTTSLWVCPKQNSGHKL